MTSSVLDAPPGTLLGDQRPRLCSLPPIPPLSSAGAEAVELVASAGIVLDDWQSFVLDRSLGERAPDRWAAFEVGLIVSRQNGKGTILEARELAGLFLFGEELILHSAHEFKTASDAFRRIAATVQDNRQFSRHVKRIRTANGSEMIELKGGQRLRFVARSAGSGRGFSADVVILDEAYELGDKEMEALLPTLSARPNPQVWYASTAGGPMSVQLGRIRERGLRGGDRSLAFFEWSAAEDDDPSDPAVWAKANPGLGIRISEEYVRREQATLSVDGFARERLSVGDYPVDGGAQVRAEQWAACEDRASQIDGPVALAFAVERDGSTAAIAVAGRRTDGRGHGELTDPPRRGTAWLIPRVLDLADRHDARVVVINPAAGAGAFEKELAEHGWVTKPGPGERQLQVVGAREYAQACGALAADVANDQWRHLGQQELDAAVAGAQTRDLADAWAWSWKRSRTDISPLEAVTLARHGFMTFGVRAAPAPDVF